MRVRAVLLVLGFIAVPACGGNGCDAAFDHLLDAAREVGAVAEPSEEAMTAFFDSLAAAEAACGGRLPELIEQHPELQESLEG